MKAFSLLEALIVLFIFGLFIGIFSTSFLEIQKFKNLEDENYFLTLQTKTSLQIFKNHLRLGLANSIQSMQNSLEFLIPLNDFALINGYSYPCFSGFLESVSLKNQALEAKILAFPQTVGHNTCGNIFKRADYALFTYKNQNSQSFYKQTFRAKILDLDSRHISLNLPIFIKDALKNNEKIKISPKIYLLGENSQTKIFLKDNQLLLKTHQNIEILAPNILSFNIKAHKLGFVITLCSTNNSTKDKTLCLSDLLLFEEFSYVL